jgi:hypothetical protein
MSKFFGLIMMLAAMYVGMTLHAEGMEKAFGGVFAPIEPMERDGSAAAALTGHAQAVDSPDGAGPSVRVTDRVRNRVTAHMEKGAERRGY